MVDQDGAATNRIEALAREVAEDFRVTQRVLAFGEWFELLCAQPTIHARNSAQYARDAFDHFGRRDVRTPSGQAVRFRLFDREFDEGHRLVGQEPAQNELFEAIEGFARLGRVDALILLHGPNGSAKSTLLDCLQRGLEVYSRTEQGALYRFAWVFPTRQPKGGGIGFGAAPLREALGEESFAKLQGEHIEARVADEHKDHPIYLIPIEQRRALLDELCAKYPSFVVSDSIRNGDLSARNRAIFDALLNANTGDLRRVLQYVQVERFFLSRTYRSGLVDVEAKQAVDARSFPVTGDRAFSHLPPSVMGQVLHGMQGDLVDANRGLVNYADLLKRPYEHYKYLLTATEAGHVALDHVVLDLDVLFTGSANDINLLEFRTLRSAEYQSFRQRLRLIPVPYLLDYRVERKIYQEQVGDLLRGIHIAPHVPRILALWGVMTRLRRPNKDEYDAKIQATIENLSPIQKADLYAYGRVPRGLSSDEARELLAAVPRLHRERFDHAVVRTESGEQHVLSDYEGSFGASVRDLKGVLLATAARPGASSVTVPRLFEELRAYLEDKANHRWMGLEPAAGFHRLDGDGSITHAAWERWLDLSDSEVREALGLVDSVRYLELFRKYAIHSSYHLKREKLFDEVTGQLTEPEERFMGEIEDSIDPKARGDRLRFRKEIWARIGAWALSHPNEEPAYEQIFPDYFARMREEYYRQQKGTVAKGIQYILELLKEDGAPRSELDLSATEKDKAKHALEVLLGAHDGAERRERHTRETLRETLVHLAKHRY
jgi:predicted Ser/Thr protein kinase